MSALRSVDLAHVGSVGGVVAAASAYGSITAKSGAPDVEAQSVASQLEDRLLSPSSGMV